MSKPVDIQKLVNAHQEKRRQLVRDAGTPQGPWSVHADGCGQVWSPSGIVAEVWTGGEDDPRMEGGPAPSSKKPDTQAAWGRMQANAQLIAAAPGLLSAAKKNLKMLAAMLEEDEWTPSARVTLALMAANTEAAINRAEGKTE